MGCVVAKFCHAFVGAHFTSLTTAASGRYDVVVTELEKRVRALEAELATASQKGDPRELAALLGRLGSNLEAIGKRARATEMLRRSVALFEEIGDRCGLADSLNRLGSVIRFEQPDEARAVLQRALETAREANDRSEEATSFNNLAILEEVAGNLNTSLAHYKRSLDLLRDLDDRRKLASTLNNMAVLLGKRGENDEAQQAWREALSILEQLGDTSTLASTHNNIGIFLERRGDPQAAIRHYKDAIGIQEKLGDLGELTIFFGNLAHVYRSLDQRADAVRALERRLALQEQSGEKRGVAATLHELGNVEDVITPETDVYYARAMAAFDALSEPVETALVEMDRARAWSRAGDHARALAFGEHALGLREKLGNDLYLAAALDNLGLLYSEAGEHAKSIALMERSLALAVKLGDSEGTLIVLCNLADEYAATDLEVKAIECLRRALPMAEKAGDRDTLSSVLDELGGIHWSLADDAPAIAFTRRALAMYEHDQKHEAVARLRRRLEKLERKCSEN
jgi:tetratricopeptide (TPR) repeat protein